MVRLSKAQLLERLDERFEMHWEARHRNRLAAGLPCRSEYPRIVDIELGQNVRGEHFNRKLTLRIQIDGVEVICEAVYHYRRIADLISIFGLYEDQRVVVGEMFLYFVREILRDKDGRGAWFEKWEKAPAEG